MTWLNISYKKKKNSEHHYHHHLIKYGMDNYWNEI